MFWNNEFLDSSPSHIDVVLQMPTVKLSDILFEEDLLQELKTSNITLTNFLNKPEIIAELVDNITQLTEKDCCDKTLYSRVHAAYISCEILTGGSSEIFAALMNHPESLNKILTCLCTTKKSTPTSATPTSTTTTATTATETTTTTITTSDVAATTPTSTSPPLSQSPSEEKAPVPDDIVINDTASADEQPEDEERLKTEAETPTNNNSSDEALHEDIPMETSPRSDLPEKEDEIEGETKDATPLSNGETIEQENNHKGEENHEEKVEPEKVREKDELDGYIDQPTADTTNSDDDNNDIVTRVVQQKATLVSKLINMIHSSSAASLSCHITQDISSFKKLIDLLVQNVDISGAFEILSTFIKKTSPPETRYVFCEMMTKLNFVYSLIDMMTISGAEDKQRNACQLICDIIVIGRQEASEQPDSGPMAQDMLAELVESRDAVHRLLTQMFPDDNEPNSTSIICGMKVLQTLLEKKPTSDEHQFERTLLQTQEEIEAHIIKFHELLMNPPKQDPIKTTFGIIQKPLGYMRLEAVNLIRALISTNSPNIIGKLVELKTMDVIVDLFIQYYWNNLLHTQVEQALCLIIRNCRADEELNFHSEQVSSSNISTSDGASSETTTTITENSINNTDTDTNKTATTNNTQENIPSRALLSQLLNECDLIGRLLIPDNLEDAIIIKNNNSEQANFGHIIQMINSIAINRDLDTIRDHLNAMKDKNPELYDRWTTFVNVDVASFKEISLYYDAQSAQNNVNSRYMHSQHNNHISNNNSPLTNNSSQHTNNTNNNNMNSTSTNGTADDQLLTYFSFTREVVIPAINKDVLPRLRRSKNAH